MDADNSQSHLCPFAKSAVPVFVADGNYSQFSGITCGRSAEINGVPADSRAAGATASGFVGEPAASAVPLTRDP